MFMTHLTMITMITMITVTMRTMITTTRGLERMRRSLLSKRREGGSISLNMVNGLSRVNGLSSIMG